MRQRSAGCSQPAEEFAPLVYRGNKTIDLRASRLPTNHGESIVMHILDKEGLRLGLAELGFFADDQQTFERLIGLPDGMITLDSFLIEKYLQGMIARGRQVRTTTSRSIRILSSGVYGLHFIVWSFPSRPRLTSPVC